MATSDEKLRKFEENAYIVYQQYFPERRIARDEVPYAKIHSIMTEYFVKAGVIPPSMDSPYNKRDDCSSSAEERNETTTAEASDDSSSRLSFLDENFLFQTRSVVRAANLERDGVDIKTSPKCPKQVRKLRQIRERRRQANFTEECAVFRCSEDDLPATFSSFWKKLIETRSTPIECYHITINSLLTFFSQISWPSSVQRLTNEFISQCVLQSSTQLREWYDANIEKIDKNKLILEYEVFTLLDLYYIKDQKQLGKSDVPDKLRFIYMATEPSHMRQFLDEVITDEFGHIIPEIISQIYEELCIELPCDLEDYGRCAKSHNEQPFPVVNVKKTNHRVASLDRFFNEEDNSPGLSERDVPKRSSTSSKSSKLSSSLLHSARRSSRGSHNSLNGLEKCTPVKRRKANAFAANNHIFSEEECKKALSRRSLRIPETPESKMCKKRPRSVDGEGSKDVVLQTPIEKISKFKRGKSQKLVTLLEASENRLKALNGASLNSLSMSQCSFTAKSTPVRTKINASAFLPSPGPIIPTINSRHTKRNGSAKFNLQQKLEQCSSQNSSASPMKTENVPPNASHLENISNEVELDRAVIDRYRRRMENIRQWARKTDKNEVFYGRCATRRNLFVEAKEESDSPRISTRSLTANSSSKNRSGHFVSHNNCVYMAHALLNVHNKTPLSPSKAPKNSPFKLHRLVRPATKSDRKRLSKLRMRIQKERLNATATSGTLPHADSA